MEPSSQLLHSVAALQFLEENVDISQVQQWLKDCTEGKGTHKQCATGKGGEDDTPRRLIDVGEPEHWPCVPKLLDTENIQGGNAETLRYIALSHSWGTLSEVEQMLMSTTIDTLEDRQAGMNLLSLPTQYQAVIVLCRSLGIRYLWIDSLCIIQGPLGDWSTESGRMAQIYGYAFLTISTNTVQNLLTSLPDSGNPTSQQMARDTLASFYKKASSRGEQLWHVIFWKRVLEDGPIGDRAWCLQERHLSPRVLHLIDGGIMVYECTGVIRSTASKDILTFVNEPDHARILGRDHSRALLPRFVDLKMRDTGTYDFLRFWYSIFTDYQKRQLKVRSDNLTALQGIAELMLQSRVLTYLSGIWLEDLARGLLWARNNAGKPEDDADEATRRRAWTRFAHYQGPTWSWCSVNGSTRMFDIDKSLAHVEEVRVPQNENDRQRDKSRVSLFSLIQVQALRPAGGVCPLQEGSYLEMDAYLCRFWYVCGQQDNTGHLRSPPEAAVPVGGGSVIFDIPADWCNRELWCLAIASSPGLSTNPGQQEYLGLAVEDLHADPHQNTSGTSAHGTASHPFELRRLGLAIMRIFRDFSVLIHSQSIRPANELLQAGFKGPMRVRLL